MKKLCSILFVSFIVAFNVYCQQQKEILYVGTYSVRDSKGIYVFEFNRAKGSLKLLQAINDAASPSYLEIHPSGKFLYAVNRGAIEGYPESGSVTAYSIDSKTGTLTFLNHVASFGKEPCHINIDQTGEWAFISNYNEGNFVVLPILENGFLGSVMDSKKYSGSSVNKFRQGQPHIHSAEISQDNKYVYVSDLGTDKIYSYKLDSNTGKISSTAKGEVKVSAGSGPRHFTLHPNGQFAYSAEELTSSVAVFSVDSSSGDLTLLQDTVKSLPNSFTGINTSADIHTDARGKFLYLSNRGYDAIAIYNIGPDGKVKLSGEQKTQGKTPRNFLVDPKGRFLLVANQDSDNITIFRMHPKNGMLIPTGKHAKIPSPVCLKLLTLK